MNLTLYLMRHGRTVPETPWRFLGQRDVALSDAGRAQAAWWRGTLSGVDFAGVWCSDLARCRETAGLVLEGRGLEARPVAGLREISLGEWDGLGVEDVKRRYPGQYEARGADIAGFRPPGGESFTDIADRAWAELENILRPARSGPVNRVGEPEPAGLQARSTHPVAAEAGGKPGANLLVVAHAGVNRTLLCRLLGMPLSGLFRLGQDHGCMNVLRWKGDTHVVQALNLPAGGLLPGGS